MTASLDAVVTAYHGGGGCLRSDCANAQRLQICADAVVQRAVSGQREVDGGRDSGLWPRVLVAA
ncbi:hypothetical protein SESBI_43136 [Sesbania bispinosa]|nr:hypothetical protein SESBI_43136 [Sesbania bispinosa]